MPGQWSYAPLTPEEVRWFWTKPSLSLKAVYQLDVPHRAHLLRYCDKDNIRLERAYRDQAENIERAWWEEQAQFTSGPANKDQAKQKPANDEEASVSWQDHVLGDASKEGPGVLVRSGHYEVDLKRRRMQPCYWPDSRHRVQRGSWFLQKGTDWVPLKEATADELEEAYRSGVWLPERGRLSSFHGTQAARVQLLTLANELKGMFALFVDEQTIYLTKDDSAFTWLSRKLKESIDIGSRLCRGYPPPAPVSPGGTPAPSPQIDPRAEEADNMADSLPIGRLLLVVHGIGQNLTGSNIAADADAVRANLYELAGDQLPDEAKDGMRTEVLPVQWRKHLALDVDSLAEALMPPGVKSLRSMLHATCVEVLLSLTPLHAQDMLDSLVAFLNAQHAKFMARNLDFKGNISIMAHSLGSVLMWDVLCNQPHLHAGLSDMPPSLQPVPLAPRPSPPALQRQSASSQDQQADGADKDMRASISSDLIDLSCITSPTGQGGPASPPSVFSSSPQPDSQPASHSPNNAETQADPTWGTGTSAHASAEQAGTSSIKDRRPAEANELAAGAITQVEVKRLAFAVDQFIAVGSPLGIFLALRRIDPSKGRGLGTPAAAQLTSSIAMHGGDGLPAVRRMYNLYHPFDPVAYRLEPLIIAGAEKRRPVYAVLSRGGRRLHVGITEFSEDVSAAASRASNALISGLRYGGGAVAKAVSTRAKVEAKEGEGKGNVAGAKQEEEEAAEDAAFRSSTLDNGAPHSTNVWRITDGPGTSSVSSRLAAGRLDFVLQAGNVENPWLSAMSSHFAYWASTDTALFVLRALHGLDVRQGTPLGMPGVAADGRAVTSPGPAAGVSSRVTSPVTSPRASWI